MIATDNCAHVILKFATEYDNKEVLDNVRSKLSNIKTKLPIEAESPILNVRLIGNLLERVLTQIARKLKKGIKSLPNVFKVEVAGVRKETEEVIVEPTVLTKYNTQYRLVGAGSLENDTGKYSITQQILCNQNIRIIKKYRRYYEYSIRSQDYAVLRIKDIAKVYPRFEDH